MGSPFQKRPRGRLQRLLDALLLRRADRAVEDRTGDPDAWAPGDMAECIVFGKWINAFGESCADPQRGWTGIVDAIRLSPDFFGRARVFLIFARWPDRMFDARAFRKLTPRADDATAADLAFLKELEKHRTPPLPEYPPAACLAHMFEERILP